jgi:hypothetical protein
MLRLIIFRYYKNIIFDFVCDISLYNYTVDNTLSHSGNDKDTCNRVFYSEMTAFTDQYSLPNTWASLSLFPRFAPNTHI